MQHSARLFNCARCNRLIIICSCCDRNNIYCCPDCAEIARKNSLREAGKRYQNSLKGKHKHADRQRRYRLRKNKVTHHTSPNSSDNVLLSPRPNERESSIKQPITGIVSCSFCGKSCSTFLRSDFLHRQAEHNARYFSHWPMGP